MPNWAVAIDDRIGAHWAPEGAPLGFKWRQRVAGAELLRGVRWARNRVHHDWTDAVVLVDGGFSFPMRFPLVFFEWRWRDLDDLPAPGKGDAEGEAVYAELLAGQAARIALEQLLIVFETVLEVLEPRGWRRAELTQGEGGPG